MADNIELNLGSGGATLHTDDLGGVPIVHVQRVKVQFGVDGTGTDVNDASPLPVEIGDGTDQVVVSAAGGLSCEITASLPAGAALIGQVDINAQTAGLALAANQLAADHLVDLASEHGRNDAFAESVAIGGELDDTTPVVATEGNVSPARITPQRALHCNLRNQAGTEIGTGTDPVRVDPTGTTPQPASQSGAWDIADITGTVSLPTGAATAAGQLAADHLVDLASEHGRNDAFAEAVAIGGELDDTAPVAATEGNVSPVRITAQRAVHSNLRDNAGAELGIAAAPLQVQLGDGTDQALVSAAGGLSCEITAALPTGDNNIGNVDVLTVPADPFGADADAASVSGSISAKLRSMATDLDAVIGTDGGVGPAEVVSVGGTEVGGNIQELRVDADGHAQVDVLSGGGGPEDVDDDVVAGGQTCALSIALNYGWDGTQWERIMTDASGAMDVNLTAQTAGLALAANQLAADHLVDLASEHGRNDAFSESIAIGGELDDTATVVATEGNVSPARITAQRALHANLRDAAGAELGVSGNELQVDVVTGGGGPEDTDDDVVAGGQSAVLSLGLNYGWDGVQWERLQSDGAGALDCNITAQTAGLALAANQLAADHLVDLASEHGRNDAFAESVAVGGELDDAGTVVATEGNVSPARITAQRAFHVNVRDNAGTEMGTTANPFRTRLSDGVDEVVISAAGGLSCEITAALPAGSNLIGEVTALGPAAQGAAVTGNPVQVGVEAVEIDADPTAIDSGDVVRPIATRYGQLLTLGGHPNIITREYRTDAARTDVDIGEAVGATNHMVLLGIDVQISHAGSVSPQVRIGFGAASVPTEPADNASVAGMVVSGTYAPGSGIVKGNGQGIIGAGAAGEELRMTNSVPTGGSIRVLATYYISA